MSSSKSEPRHLENVERSGTQHSHLDQLSLPLVLTVEEAADRLGVSPQTLKQWIYKGTLRTVQTAGGHHRVAPSEVDRLLTQGGAGKSKTAAKSRPRAAPPVLVALSGRNQLRGIVEEVRSYLIVHYSYDQRVEELVAALRS